jgi:3-methyladenine DNA glycosylase/8-oxoguanine DNA glycosylase
MGAQAAALLDAAAAGAPLGDLPAAAPGAGRVALPGAGTALWRTALAHGGVGLAPFAWDGTRLHLRLPGPVVVGPDLVAAWSGPAPGPAALARVLALHDDLEPLWQACDAVPGLGWVRATGAGRVLRSPTVWQDLVGALAQVRSSYRGAQARVRTLVADGPFPEPSAVLARADLPGWGLREPWLRALARAVDAGRVDPERWLDQGLPAAQVGDELRALGGIGRFTAAQVLPLLGRPRPLVLDGWLREQLGGLDDRQLAARFAPAGSWAGTAAWLAALAPRLAEPRA